jgi:hypothetical protein
MGTNLMGLASSDPYLLKKKKLLSNSFSVTGIDFTPNPNPNPNPNLLG